MKSGINRSAKNSPVTIRKRFLNFSWLAKFRNIAMRARGCIVRENIEITIYERGVGLIQFRLNVDGSISKLLRTPLSYVFH